jgi:hypothetical protein
MVLRDGVLVGFVPQIADSDVLPATRIAELIAGADYDARPSTRPRTSPSPAAPLTPAQQRQQRWRDRLRKRGG